MKKEKGITLVALIITIIVILILVGISVKILSQEKLLKKTEEASIKQTISLIEEQISVKSAEIIAENVSQTGKVKTVDAKDVIEEYKMDNTLINIENNLKCIANTKKTLVNPCYVLDTDILEIETIRGKGKSTDIYVLDANKNVFYVTDIVETEENINNQGSNISNIIGNFEIMVKEVNPVSIIIDKTKNIELLKDGTIEGYIAFIGDQVVEVSNELPVRITNLSKDTTYENIYLKAIDNKGNLKQSSNKVSATTPHMEYWYQEGKEVKSISAQYTPSSGTRTKNADNLYMQFNDTRTDWHYSCYFGLNEKIDVTNIEKIYVRYSNIELTGETSAVINLSTKRDYYGPGGIINWYNEFVSGSDITIEYDVSSLTGSYYLDFGIGSHADDVQASNEHKGTGKATIIDVGYSEKQ